MPRIEATHGHLDPSTVDRLDVVVAGDRTEVREHRLLQCGGLAEMEQVIENHTAVLGPLYPQILALRGSLESLLADQLQVFDTDHPQVRGTRHAITVMRDAAPPPETP